MKAIVLHEYGDPDVLRFEEVATPEPAPGRRSDIVSQAIVVFTFRFWSLLAQMNQSGNGLLAAFVSIQKQIVITVAVAGPEPKYAMCFESPFANQLREHGFGIGK